MTNEERVIKDMKKTIEPLGFRVLEDKQADDFIEWFLKQNNGDKK